MFSWLDSVGKIISGLVYQLFNPHGFVHDPVGVLWAFFLHTFLGSVHNPNSPLGFIFQTITGTLNPVDYKVIPKLYAVMVPVALAAITVATAARYFTLMKDSKMAPGMALFDVLPRWLICTLLLAPGTNFAFAFYGFVVGAFSQMFGAITVALLSVNAAGGLVTTAISALLADVATGVAAFLMPGMQPVASVLLILAISLLALILWLGGLLLMRTVSLIFGLIFLPLALAVGVYDTRNGFFQWWLGSVMGALVAGLFGGVGFAVSLDVAVNAPGGVSPFHALIAIFLMDAGLFVSIKAVQAAEGGALHGAGMGIAGLVEIAALSPRALRNVVGDRIGQRPGAAWPSRRGRQAAAGDGGTGGPPGGGGGAGGGGGGGGGFGAGRRGFVGLLTPRHNVFADGVGVAMTAGVGAAKGALRPGEGGRPRSVVRGLQQGYRTGLGRGTVEDSEALFAKRTGAGRRQTAGIDARLAGTESAMKQRHATILAQAQTSAAAARAGSRDPEVGAWASSQGLAGPPADHRARFADAQLAVAEGRVEAERSEFTAAAGHIRHGVAGQNLRNDQGHVHPGLPGRLGRLSPAQEAALKQRLTELDHRYGAGDGRAPTEGESP